MTKFNNYYLLNMNFDKYLKAKDKFESLYIFVIYDSNIDEFNEKIAKIMKILDNIPDSKKRGFLKSRIYDFQKNVNDNHKERINGIYFVSTKVEKEEIEKEHIATLKFFSHPKISYNFGNNYPIEWLNKLLYDMEYINVFNIRNNDIKYFIMNDTKKKYVYQDTIKSMDVKTIIHSNILKPNNKMEKYVLYGSSVNLKTFSDNMCIALINTSKDLEDSEIIEHHQKDKFKKNNLELEDLLSKITHPKFIDKLVFGDELFKELDNYLIDTVYISRNNPNLNKIKEYKVNILEVISSNKGDIIDNFIINYGGIIGKKYY